MGIMNKMFDNIEPEEDTIKPKNGKLTICHNPQFIMFLSLRSIMDLMLKLCGKCFSAVKAIFYAHNTHLNSVMKGVCEKSRILAH